MKRRNEARPRGTSSEQRPALPFGSLRTVSVGFHILYQLPHLLPLQSSADQPDDVGSLHMCVHQRASACISVRAYRAYIRSSPPQRAECRPPIGAPIPLGGSLPISVVFSFGNIPLCSFAFGQLPYTRTPCTPYTHGIRNNPLIINQQQTSRAYTFLLV